MRLAANALHSWHEVCVAVELNPLGAGDLPGERSPPPARGERWRCASPAYLWDTAEGRAESVSGWVNAALADLAARDRRRRVLGEVVAAYEAEFGGRAGAERPGDVAAPEVRAPRGS